MISMSYQINAYVKEPNKQAVIYSNLHQNIQDVCNERGIEMSPIIGLQETETKPRFLKLFRQRISSARSA
jgi:hypothetical protein